MIEVVGGYTNLLNMLHMQLKNLYGISEEEEAILRSRLVDILESLFKSFGKVSNKYFFNEEGPIFDPLHSSQYCIFLYKLSKTVNHKALSDKLYLLNKVLNSCDIYHQIDLPEIFLPEHPVGTVLGRASYNNYFVFQQNCTVGGNRGVYPSIGSHVWMFANASVIGNCQIGSNVYISAGTQIKDQSIPDNSIVFGISPNLIIKNRPADYFKERSPFIL